MGVAGRRTLRFRGVWTDGDVDEPVERHWVDNAFSPNQWQVFGSDVEPNVHAVGILTVRGTAAWTVASAATCGACLAGPRGFWI